MRKLGRKVRQYESGAQRLKLQILTSSNGKVNTTTTTSKHIAKNAGTSRAVPEYPLSTNISSPVRASSKRWGKRVQRVEEDNSEDERFQTDLRDEADDFDNDFVPVQQAGRDVQRKKPKEDFGPPITADERMAGLSEIQAYVVESFVIEAKQLAEKIAKTHGLRRSLFTDTILREIGIARPSNKEQMLDIPDIDAEKVERYAKNFLPIISRHEAQYQSMMDKAEGPVMDPAHENVVDLVSDDGGADLDEPFNESDFSSEGESSSFFDSGHNAAASNFNTQLEAAKFREQAKKPDLSRFGHDERIVREPSNTGQGYKKGYKKPYKGKASGPRSGGRKSDGIHKRSSKAHAGPAAKKGRSSAGQARGGRRAANTMTGISAMPT